MDKVMGSLGGEFMEEDSNDDEGDVLDDDILEVDKEGPWCNMEMSRKEKLEAS